MECRGNEGYDDCNFACEQGGCTVVNVDSSGHNVKLSCPGGGCTMHCGYHSRCEITDCKGGGCKCESKNSWVCRGIGAEVETAIPDCGCAAGDGWKEPKIEWTLVSETYTGEPDVPGSWQVQLAIHPPGNSVMTRHNWFELVKSEAIPFIALPDKPGMPFSAGVACDTHFMAIVGGERVNRFEAGPDGKVQQWYEKLAAPVKPPPDSRREACFALSTKNGIAAIPLEGGRRVSLDLASGRLR
jgi:hypothetical protein